MGYWDVLLWTTFLGTLAHLVVVRMANSRLSSFEVGHMETCDVCFRRKNAVGFAIMA